MTAPASLVQASCLLKAKMGAAVRELSDALEQGRSETLVKYFDVMARFHRYSFLNAVWISWQRPNATVVAGIQTWHGVDRWINNDARPIRIMVPILPQWMYRLPPAEKDRDCTCDGFREGNVFDIADTHGAAFPDLRAGKGDPGDYLSRIQAAIRNAGIILSYRTRLRDGADGLSWGGHIEIREGFDPAYEFKVLAHEYGHEILHSRNGKRPKKKVRETEAEAVAYVVCRAIGLDMINSSNDYIQLHDGNAAVLQRSLGRIHETARFILECIGCH